MATALPSSMSFEMLSRLPANSFVYTMKEVRPDQPPQNGIYDMRQSHNIRFGLRGAPNEFVLNTNMYLCADAWLAAVVNSAGAITETNLAGFGTNATIYLGDPIDFFKSSRESFNSGSLPFLDNQDPDRSKVINHLRFRCARRNVVNGGSSLNDLKGSLASPNNIFQSPRGLGYLNPVEGIRVGYKSATTPSVLYTNRSYGNKKVQIPLGTYSNFINSHSVIPIGMLSSYSVNGFTLELKTQEQNSTSGPVYNAEAQTNFGGAVTTSISASAWMKDVRIFMPVIKVLDPAVMEAVLSLYEKREMVNVGGVQFPLSLRLNHLGFRTASYPLVTSQKDYFFRIAGTDRSVRGLAWRIWKKTTIASGDFLNDAAVRVVRLETSIGNEKLHDVIEDTDVNSSNVANFISMNVKRSGALFSPLPYYQECRKFDGQQDDDIANFNNTISAGVINGTVPYIQNSEAYGVISFENIDRRESDYSGSFQASGKDLTNVGSIEIRMRIEEYPTAGIGLESATPPTVDSLVNYLNPGLQNSISTADWEIQFMYVYDAVTEISPQGVMDITNAVL